MTFVDAVDFVAAEAVDVVIRCLELLDSVMQFRSFRRTFFWRYHKEAISLGSDPYCAITALHESIRHANALLTVWAYATVQTEVAHEVIGSVIDTNYTILATCPDVSIVILEDCTDIVACEVECLVVITFDGKGILSERSLLQTIAIGAKP